MIILDKHEKYNIDTIVFDFDGTLSTLRCGWESVMEPMMAEYISGGNATDDIVALVRDYISRSTGIQTIAQMKWLAETVKKYGNNPTAPSDPWFYKADYNERLMKNVMVRRKDAANGNRNKYIIKGAEQFLSELKDQGKTILAASGTDEADVIEEAKALDLYSYFDEIAGAKPHSEDCSKEATLKRLIASNGNGKNVAVIGDGPVEIKLGREYGALTLGVAVNELNLCGINEEKFKRLNDAGAHAIVDCYENRDEIFNWMEA